MRKLLLQIIGLALTIPCGAQVSKKSLTEHSLKAAEVCGGIDSVFSRKGSWKKTSDAVIFPDQTFPRNQYFQLNARLDKIYPLMKEALPDLSGIEAKWYRVVDGKSYMPKGPVPYEFSSFYLLYYCNTNVNKILLGDETGTWAYVFINNWGWLCDKVADWNVNDDGKMVRVYSLPPKKGSWKGKTLYAPRAHDSAFAIVLGHNGKLPWHSLSQKQYLTGLKNMLEKKKNEVLEGYDNHEKKIKVSEASLKNYPPELAEKVRKQNEETIKKFRENKQKYKDDAAKHYDEELKYIHEYIANVSASELAEPAIIDPKVGVLKFRGNFGEENKGGTRVIAFSSKYFTESLPRYVPQFMVLYWIWSSDPVSLFFKKQFEENFPLEKLNAMIDK